jgi:hypothetical protein
VREGAGRVVDIVTDPVTLVGGNFRTTFGRPGWTPPF